MIHNIFLQRKLGSNTNIKETKTLSIIPIKSFTFKPMVPTSCSPAWPQSILITHKFYPIIMSQHNSFTIILFFNPTHLLILTILTQHMLLQFHSFLILLISVYNSPVSSSFTPKPSNAFYNFRFAPNGVCLKPFYFIQRISSTQPQHQQNWHQNLQPQQEHDNDQSLMQRKFTMRNVPGDGDCMFQAVALAAATSSGLGANMALLRSIVKETRQIVASILESNGNLYITDSKIVSTKQLLLSAAKSEGLSPVRYLELLRMEGKDGGLYGGGPELAVLSNVLRRPISVYEINDNDDSFTKEGDFECCNIECKGVFGSPIFEDPCLNIQDSAILSDIQPGAYSWHMHILVVNADIDSKHACVLLPQQPHLYPYPGC
jgi:hypothetical protein